MSYITKRRLVVVGASQQWEHLQQVEEIAQAEGYWVNCSPDSGVAYTHLNTGVDAALVVPELLTPKRQSKWWKPVPPSELLETNNAKKYVKKALALKVPIGRVAVESAEGQADVAINVVGPTPVSFEQTQPAELSEWLAQIAQPALQLVEKPAA